MAFDFAKLPAKAKRAAFAHMSSAKPKVGKKTLGSGARHKQLAAKRANSLKQTTQHSVPKPGGGHEIVGRISREDAAKIMFGTAGAQQRIAKAKARKR